MTHLQSEPGSSTTQPPSVGSTVTTPAPAPAATSTKAPPATVDAFDAKELLDALNSTQTGGANPGTDPTSANQGWADFGNLNAGGAGTS